MKDKNILSNIVVYCPRLSLRLACFTYKLLYMFDTTRPKRHIYDVVGALWEVHSELGPGLSEDLYKEGFEIELTELGIPFIREALLRPTFHGKPMKKYYKMDFLCKDDIVVECKGVEALSAEHRAQLFNYMRIKKAIAGILVNFTPKEIELERYFYDIRNMDIVNVYGEVIKSTIRV